MKTRDYIKEMNKYVEKLSEENQEKFTNIMVRIRFSKIDDHEAEAFNYHCLDLFLQAEKENVPVESLLGEKDLDKFCTDFIKETQGGYSLLKRIYIKFWFLPMAAFIFTGIFQMLSRLLRDWDRTKSFESMVPVSVSMIVNTIIVIVMITLLISKTPVFFKVFNGNDKKKDRRYSFLLWLGLMAMIGVFVLTELTLTHVLFRVNFFIYMAVVGGICIFQNILKRC